jgi:signal peptidase II
LFYATAAAAVVADQVTKFVMLAWLTQQPERRAHVIGGLFDLYLQFNTGGAFSLFHDRPLIILVFALVAVAWMIWYVHRLPGAARLVQLSFGLIVGGAIGNLIDRFRLGCVIDFFHVYWRDWYWPTFNVADSAICVGVALYVIVALLGRETPAAPSAAQMQRGESPPAEDTSVQEPPAEPRS